MISILASKQSCLHLKKKTELSSSLDITVIVCFLPIGCLSGVQEAIPCYALQVLMHLILSFFFSSDAGHSFVVDQLDFSSSLTVYTTTVNGLTCLGSCRHHSSLVTWPASATPSSSCWAWLVSVPPCYSFAIYTNPSNVSRLCIVGEGQR